MPTANGSNIVPAAYASHPLVARFANEARWINWEPMPTGKKRPVKPWKRSKDELHIRPHLEPINSHDITNGIPFLEAYENTQHFPRCGIGFIPAGTTVACIDCDIKHIDDPAEREAVRNGHIRLCEEFDTFTEQSANRGFHAWIDLTNKDGLERHKKIVEQHLELFINHNFVAINPDPKQCNGKTIANRQELLLAKFPQIVSSNGHVRNENAPNPRPTGGG